MERQLYDSSPDDDMTVSESSWHLDWLLVLTRVPPKTSISCLSWPESAPGRPAATTPHSNGGQLLKARDEPGCVQAMHSDWPGFHFPWGFGCWYYTHCLLHYGDLKVIRDFLFFSRSRGQAYLPSAKYDPVPWVGSNYRIPRVTMKRTTTLTSSWLLRSMYINMKSAQCINMHCLEKE